MGGSRRETGVRQVSISSNEVKKSSGVRKKEHCPGLRRSKRLKNIQKRLELERAQREQERTQSLEISCRKRKRPQSIDVPFEDLERSKAYRKRARTSAAVASAEENRVPILYWIKYGRWPEKYSESNGMSHLLARKKSETSLARKRSNASSVTPSPTTSSDEKPREAKSAPYARSSYATILATKGSFMDKSERGVADTSKLLCSSLLEKDQTVPRESLFDDDLFEITCRKIGDRNEAMVIRDVGLLVVPSAQTLATRGLMHLEHLTESVNEGWNSAIPVYGPRPQPDYSVGFGRSAFSDDQLEKLKPFVGDIADSLTSYFMATWRMYFPFLTCEVKCGAAALDIADRQNAHSMTLAVRAVVELFRYVEREKELDREILAFSISHDHRSVRMYGHYAVINGKTQTYYRHPIRTFDFTEMDGKEKWTAYKFTKNIYDIWMPKHFERICSAIEQFPSEVNFDMSQSKFLLTEKSELSQESGASRLALSFASSHSSQDLADSQSSVVDAQNATPNTSVNEAGAVEKPKRKRGRKATRTPSPRILER